MDYGKEIDGYRSRIKNERTQRFIDFLDILFEWVEELYKTKRLERELEKDILNHMPREIFKKLDGISPTELTQDEYEELERILHREAEELIEFIIDVGNLRMTDFDVVQFNLSQIFGKGNTTGMIERARDHISLLIRDRGLMERERRERDRRRREEYSKGIRAMPQGELNKLAVEALFDFTPSARTPEERLVAIRNNQGGVIAQRIKFERFERKLIDATTGARKDAQTGVYKQIGNVKRNMNKVRDEFGKKAKEFVSDEGPKKDIGKARGRIMDKRESLRRELEGRGRDWEVHFRTRTYKAQSEIMKHRGLLSSEQKQTMDIIVKRGFHELDKARGLILDGQADFEIGVETARDMFSGKEQEINKAKSDFSEKREIVRGEFSRRGNEIETDMYGMIYKGRKRFGCERDDAQLRIKERTDELGVQSSAYINRKRDKFRADREIAQRIFLSTAGEAETKSIRERVEMTEPGGRVELIASAGDARNRIEQKHRAMIEKAGFNRERMQQEMAHSRDILSYDIRFARYTMQEHAEQFAEKTEVKREEFEKKQERIIARHRAHQKAHLIQNLLKTIRTMH